ncbi:MAG: hypothetical protein ACYDHX_05860 [Methanothrix sp.]
MAGRRDLRVLRNSQLLVLSSSAARMLAGSYLAEVAGTASRQGAGGQLRGCARGRRLWAGLAAWSSGWAVLPGKRSCEGAGGRSGLRTR